MLPQYYAGFALVVIFSKRWWLWDCEQIVFLRDFFISGHDVLSFFGRCLAFLL